MWISPSYIWLSPSYTWLLPSYTCLRTMLTTTSIAAVVVTFSHAPLTLTKSLTVSTILEIISRVIERWCQYYTTININIIISGEQLSCEHLSYEHYVCAPALLAPSWKALQHLLSVIEHHC